MSRLFQKLKAYLNNISVKTKVLGITIGLVLLMGLTSTVILREILVVKLTEDLHRRAISIGSDVSSRSADFAILKDILNLHSLIQDTIRNNPDIEYIFIVDENLNIINHSFGRGFQVSEQLITSNLFSKEILPYQLVTFPSTLGTIHDVITPIIDGEAGYVRVGLNEKQIYKTIDEITFLIIIVTILVGALGFLISYLLTKVIYQGISHLMEVSKKVGTGNLDCDVEINSKDEIGMLANEFKTMISRLKAKNLENKNYMNVLHLRNSELSLLHKLAVSSMDIENFNRHVETTAELLMSELDLNSFFIELEFKGERITAFKGKNKCETRICEACSLHAENKEIRETHFYIPIMNNQRKVGQLNVCFDKKPDETTKKFIYSFTSQLSVITENVRLWKELKYKEELRLQLLERVITAQEEERKRIARELHDETSQSITSINVGLTLLQEYPIPDEAQQKVVELKEITQQTLDEVHYISWSLRPSVLDDLGLLPAIKKYVIEYMKKYPIDVDIQVIGFKYVRLLPLFEVTIYRVIQEALTNAARHSKAENISIILKHTNGNVSIIIEDDGVGFDTNRILTRNLTKDHLGLKGMQERIESINGKLVIESIPNTGTTIYVKDILIGDEEHDQAKNHVS